MRTTGTTMERPHPTGPPAAEPVSDNLRPGAGGIMEHGRRVAGPIWRAAVRGLAGRS